MGPTFKRKIVAIISAAVLIACVAAPGALNAQEKPQGMDQYLNGVIQYGFAEVTFRERNVRMETAVENRNQIQTMLESSYEAGPASVNNIFSAAEQHQETSREVKAAIAQQRQQREAGAAANGEFKYIKYSDKTVFFQDGLTTRVEGQKEPDEFGNMQVKNMYQMKYNEKQLLISYKGDSTDQLGNTTYFSWSGATYSPDSVFYAADDTNAVKNMLTYTMEEMDHAGNVTVTRFNGAAYEGKYLRAFSETIEDSIYGTTNFTRSNITYAGGDMQKVASYHEEGLTAQNQPYKLDRTHITYNDNRDVTGYQEIKVLAHPDGGTETITTNAQFSYLDQNHLFADNTDTQFVRGKILGSRIKTTLELSDGLKNTENTVTKYEYDGDKIVGASGHSQISGHEADWWQYTDTQGHLLSRAEKDGVTSYFYMDSATKTMVTVPCDQVTAEIKDGNLYEGTADDTYEVLNGKPMLNETQRSISYRAGDGVISRVEQTTTTYTNGLKNNIQRLLGSQDHVVMHHPNVDPTDEHIATQEVNTTYFYDLKGNLVDAKGSGQGGGSESESGGLWRKYNTTITLGYQVILGKATRETYEEAKLYQDIQ
jgi:hypothetical protein